MMIGRTDETEIAALHGSSISVQVLELGGAEGREPHPRALFH